MRDPKASAKKISKSRSGAKFLAWAASLLLLGGFFTLALYPAQRLVGLWSGEDRDFKRLPFNLQVDGFKTLWGYSGWLGPDELLSEHRSEEPVKDHNRSGRPMVINGLTYFNGGIGVHAPSKIAFDLGGKAQRFSCRVGLDAATDERLSQGVFCSVLGDGTVLFKGPVLKMGSNPLPIDVPTAGVRILILVVDTTDLEDVGSDVDWVDLKFTR